MTIQFKKGQLVRCIDNDFAVMLEVGMIYIVQGVIDSSGIVSGVQVSVAHEHLTALPNSIVEVYGAFNTHRFEPLSPSEEEAYYRNHYRNTALAAAKELGFAVPASADAAIALNGASLSGGSIQSDGKKDTNPKDAVGTKKPALSCVPLPVLMEVGIGMMEGARKYGRHNYRISAVRASVYFDATIRHLFAWFEGEDLDPDSGLSHVTKAITSLIVLRDAMIQDKVVDDRPPSSPEAWLKNLQPNVDAVFDRHPTAVPAYTHEDKVKFVIEEQKTVPVINRFGGYEEVSKING